MLMPTKVLDSAGNPVMRKVMTERVAEPGITSVRQAFVHSVASGLTPVRLAGILQSAAQGNIQDYLILAEEMEEKDPHYGSVLGIRKRAISGIEPQVKPASDSPQDKTIADAVREHIAEHDGFSDLVEDMLDALGKGFSQTEIIWGRDKSSWWIEEFVHRDPRFFQFDDDTGREVRLVDEADMVNGLPLDPMKWISHKAKLKSGIPIRGGLARLVAFTWMCKAYSIKDWMAFVETYGLPLRLGKYGGSATADDVDKLFTAVANIGTDAAAVLPESMRIEFEQVAAGPGNDIFEKFARWGDEQTSKAVLGQTMTSDNGSSMAQAEVHNDVRLDIAKSDAKSVTGTLKRDLVVPFVIVNFGVQEHYPKLVIRVDEPEDTDMILQNTDRMVAHGLKVKSSELRSRLGFSEPDDDDEVIGGTPATPPTPTGEARNRAGAPDPYDALDELEGAALDDWEPVMEDVLGSLVDDLENATTYDEAAQILKTAYPQMGSAALIEQLVAMLFKARADGDASDAA